MLFKCLAHFLSFTKYSKKFIYKSEIWIEHQAGDSKKLGSQISFSLHWYGRSNLEFDKDVEI